MSNDRTPDRSTLAIIRTSRMGGEEARTIEALTPWFGSHMVAAVDARTASRKDFRPEDVLIDNDTLLHHQLNPISDWGWRCGDYFAICTARRYPDYHYYFMIEPDVVLNFQDRTAFFDKLESYNHDFIAYGYGDRKMNWNHYHSVSDIYEKVFGCLFPITRFSKEAITHIHDARIEYDAYWRQLDNPKKYANDESLSSSCIGNSDLKAEAIEKLLPDYFDSKSFTVDNVLLETDLAKYPQTVLHPVKYIYEAGTKIADKVNRKNVALLGSYSEKLAKINDDEANRLFFKKSLNLLSKLHLGENFATKKLEAPENGKVSRGFVASRQRPWKWTRSHPENFTFSCIEEFSDLDLDKAFPYAVNYIENSICLVDTSNRQIFELGSLHWSQYLHAVYAINTSIDFFESLLDGTDSSKVRIVFCPNEDFLGSLRVKLDSHSEPVVSFSHVFSDLSEARKEVPFSLLKHQLHIVLAIIRKRLESERITFLLGPGGCWDAGVLFDAFPKSQFVFSNLDLETYCTQRIMLGNSSVEEAVAPLKGILHAYNLAKRKDCRYSVEDIQALLPDLRATLESTNLYKTGIEGEVAALIGKLQSVLGTEVSSDLFSTNPI